MIGNLLTVAALETKIVLFSKHEEEETHLYTVPIFSSLANGSTSTSKLQRAPKIYHIVQNKRKYLKS